MGLLFRQLADPVSNTYTYLLADRASGEAVLIDTVFEQAARDAALVEELGLRLVATLETHVHADHVTAAWLLRERLGSAIVLGAASGAKGADRYLSDGEPVAFGSRHLEARSTPGHTNGCMTYVLDDRSMAFTGDCLLIRGCGRTDFQQGDNAALFRSVREKIFTLPDECLLYPGHDYRGLMATSVAEERRHNPRLREGVAEGDFAGYMANLGLPHPKQMAVAVPANLECGRPASGVVEAVPTWAPVNMTFAGIPELAPRVVEERRGDFQLVDVREPDEWTGPLGSIEGALPMPIGQLPMRVGELDRSRPIVAVCRSGARSAQAVVMLKRLGFDQVANLAGGMIRWRADGL